MRRWIRLVRGAVGTGLTWAVAWTGVGAVVGVAKWFFAGSTALLPVFINSVGAFAAAGFVFGLTFSAVLAAVERRRTFGEMSVGRFAALGGVTGLVLFIALGVAGSHSSIVDAILNGILPFLGAGSAAATLALARRGSPLVGSDETVNQIEDKPLVDNTTT